MIEANAKKLLFDVADVLEEVGVEFFLYGGTLLGAVREKKFIEIDRDIDLAILQEELLPAVEDIRIRLIRKGIKAHVVDHRHRRAWTFGAYAIKFRRPGLPGDLSAFRKMEGKRVVPSHMSGFWLVHTARFLEELSTIEFYGRTFKCPKDTDGFLTEKYGDWRTPHKEFYNISKCRKDETWKDDID